PGGRLARIAVLYAAGLDRAVRRVVAGEIAGVDVEAANAAGHGKPDHRMVMAGHALAAALPAVHPLAVLVIDAFLPESRLVGEHARQRREEIVGDEKPPGAKAGRGEVDRAIRE